MHRAISENSWRFSIPAVHLLRSIPLNGNGFRDDLKDAFNDGRLSTLVQDQGVRNFSRRMQEGVRSLQIRRLSIQSMCGGVNYTTLTAMENWTLLLAAVRNILVFKNMGENKFQLMAQLSDPTPPLSGDATNQFGPPRTWSAIFPERETQKSYLPIMTETW